MAENSIERRPPPAKVEVRFSEGEERIRQKGTLLGSFERMSRPRKAILELTSQRLIVRPRSQRASGNPQENPIFQLGFKEIRAIQTTSASLQIAAAGQTLVQFLFQEDSPKRWEEALQCAVRRAFREAGRGEITEFQPRIVSFRPESSGPSRSAGSSSARFFELGRNQKPVGGTAPGSPSWYRAVRGFFKPLVALGIRLSVQGIENIPEVGPFILVANHQSFLDPILVQTTCPRPLFTFTKSTEFGRPFHRWFLTRVNAIPTRRYTVDPQVIRIALRRLSEGQGVCIYPEGERSWDGTVQPFRQGTIRFLLGAGVPVVPCGIDGSYDVWPRWSGRIRRHRVRLSFGESISWPQRAHRTERYAAAPEAAKQLREALVRLGAWSG